MIGWQPMHNFLLNWSLKQFYFVACRKGEYRHPVRQHCTDCTAGTYSDTEEAASCTPCPEGYSTYSIRSDDASDCIGKTYFEITFH